MMRSFVAVLALAISGMAFQGQPQTPLERVRSRIESITRSVNATWGIYIKSLDTREEITIRPDEQMDTMSVIKIPLMVEAYRQAAEGRFKLSDNHTLKEAEKRPGTGIMQRWAEGTLMSWTDIIDLMIIVSDNTATDLVFEKVGGPEAVSKLMETYGYDKIRATGFTADWFKALRESKDRAAFHREGKHPFGLATPRQIGLLLEKIAKGEAVNKEASQKMMEHMRGQLYATRIPRYLSFTGFSTRPPHKTGDFLPYIGNDVGVLEGGGRQVVISIFTANHFGMGMLLEQAIGQITEQAASYFSNR
jgi:beta-lactamase class A